MIKSVTVTNSLGESAKIVLTQADPDHGFLIEKIDGLGPPKADINTTVLATIDGTTFNTAHLNERNIVLGLLFTYASIIEDARLRTYQYFPIKREVELRIDTDHRAGKIKGLVESNEPDIFSKQENTQISIICPDPYFYSAIGSGESSTVMNNGMFEFAFENESITEPMLEMSVIGQTLEQIVPYVGDGETGMEIHIYIKDEITNLILYNTRTREQFGIDTTRITAITGSALSAGDEIVISTVRGNKYLHLIRNGEEINIINAKMRGSTWLQLEKGPNPFLYSVESGEGNVILEFRAKIRYEGM